MVRLGLLLILAGCAQPMGLPTGAIGVLTKPDGPGPFPAVVVLHGCNGVSPHMQAWAQRLNRWGYAAVVVDSFGPRGYPDGVCAKGLLVPPEERARDAFAAAAWLRSQPFVDGAHIGVIGFSHGGWTIMRAILETAVREAGATPFQAAVAYYPFCPMGRTPIASDTLILIGDADDWTPAPRCTTYVAAQIAPPHALEIKVYPGATHAFDVMAAPRTAFGHFMSYDPAATDDSFDMTRRFFDARLKVHAG